jgi:hypothetical protein
MKLQTAFLPAAAALLALASTGAARACATTVPTMTFEFAPGSAEIDKADRDELVEFLRQARALKPVPALTLRAFADRAGALDAKTWAQADLDLARARERAVTDALMMFGAPPPESAAVGVAPRDAPTRTGEDGLLRYGRAGLWVLRDEAAPERPTDGRPVPTC